LPPVQAVLESLDANRIASTLYDRVRVEPTDESFADAIAFADAGAYDGFVAVGGGSTIDTAKAVNLYTTFPPADFLHYVNPPTPRARRGRPGARALKAARGVPDSRRHRQRNDRRQHLRFDADAREDRHREPAFEADARPARSGQYPDDAAASGGVERPRHPEP